MTHPSPGYEAINLSAVTPVDLCRPYRYRLVGTRAVGGLLATGPPAPLPIGYEFAGQATIDPEELAILMQTVMIGADITTYGLVRQFDDFRSDGLDSVEIGVRRGQDGRLVGYGGLIINALSDGEFGDFVVNPSSQGQGIGKAIIDQRLLQAQAKRVKRILVANPEVTNTLLTYYKERGFQEQEDGNYVANPLT